MNKVEFEKWVNKMTTSYETHKSRYAVTCNRNLYAQVIVCGDKRTGKSGMARCHPDDRFDFDIGLAIAYARCRGYEIPKFTTYKRISDMKYGDKFIYSECIYTFIAKSTKCDCYLAELGSHSVSYFSGDERCFEMVE